MKQPKAAPKPSPPLGQPGMPPSIKRMFVYQIERAMVEQKLTRVRLAAMLNTSRAALNRILDPLNESITLQTMERISRILGKKLQIFLND
jgi:antitoxin HicB